MNKQPKLPQPDPRKLAEAFSKFLAPELQMLPREKRKDKPA